jgi:hypothetical protein
MATITGIQVDQFQGFATLFTWTGLTTATNDVGTAVYVGHLAFLSVAFVGTAGTATSLNFEGSMDGSNWGALQGTPAAPAVLTLTSGSLPTANCSGIVAIANPPLYIRPTTPVGAGGVFTAFCLGKRFS